LCPELRGKKKCEYKEESRVQQNLPSVKSTERSTTKI
jgi:hypothetical protein